jgi:hypothetical protein
MANKFQPIMLFKSVDKYKIALDMLPFLAPIKINSRKPAMQDIDLTKWKVFRVE